MAHISRIRDGLFATLNQLPGVQVYGRLTESLELPEAGAVVVGPMAYVPGAMGRGNFQWTCTVYAVVPLVDYGLATDALDALINPYGPLSIYELIWNNRHLGVLDSDGLPDVDASVTEMSNYGGTLADAAGVDHLAAQLTLLLLSPGKP
jgi:hypothetical protein